MIPIRRASCAVIVVAALAVQASAGQPRRAAVPESWVRRTAHLESRGNRWAVGDHGRSRGAYQIQRATWVRYSRIRWEVGAHDPVESRRVARLILRDCVWTCERRGQPATFGAVRQLYTHGGWRCSRW